jgi:hypothetical protein
MKASQLEANIYGLGQLIAQRKMFAVPEHQRSFAWTTEEVEEFLTDVSVALAKDSPDYFIGLIVLLGPVNTVWQILDGQQRLATATMLYAAIREWLQARSHEADAKQIQDEFIAVRQLGGKLVPRLQLNVENREVFKRNVVAANAIEAIQQSLKEEPRHSSNYRLLEAASFCRSWVDEFASSGDGARRLYKLSAYVESRVKAVSLSVSSESDAFILFESLNARGADLSALDLVKNHIFASANENLLPRIRSRWADMMQYIEGKDADDFLKVFWTSRFGVVQKLELFHNIRSVYRTEKQVMQLAEDLSSDAARFYALDDAEHEIWNSVGALGRQLVSNRITLGSKQVRPVILAAMRTFKPKEIRRAIWALIVLIVRYQIIGRGRTGILEKQLGSACQGIFNSEIKNASQLYESVSPILSEVDDFSTYFERLRETKAARVLYFFLEMESTLQFRAERSVEKILQLKGLANRVSPQHILGRNAFRDDLEDEETEFYALANRCLVEDALSQHASIDQDVATKIKNIYVQSQLSLTNELKGFGKWPSPALHKRGKRLATLANETWAFENSLYA